MSAEVLRRAAFLMRERADLPYVKGEWEATGRYIRKESKSVRIQHPAHAEATCELYDAEDALVTNEAIAEHIASWHPAVALAVADWLDDALDAHLTVRISNAPSHQKALAVARAYLGESS